MNSFLFYIALFVICAFSLIFFVLILKVGKTLKFIGRQLQQSEARLSEYRDFVKYLRHKGRTIQGESLVLIFKSIRFLRTYHIFLNKPQQEIFALYDSRAKTLSLFLEKYISEYTKREVERHKEFFAGRSLDKDQIEAIVKRDEHNLVIAGAGSGKTRTLTARIAFTIKCGAVPDEILALAYTNPAEDEMRLRLRDEYRITNANIKTFHSLARDLARLSPDFKTGVADNTQQQQFIKDSFVRLRSEKDFALLFLNFLIEWRTPEPDPADFIDVNKYYEYLRNQKYFTLNGVNVKSIAERDIANFLFLHKVNYGYETPAMWADKSEQYRLYQPDFFLPKYQIWIEHWGINRKGNVPDWFSGGESGNASAKYKEGMEWKRGQFQKHGHKLIESYNYQYMEGILVSELKKRLEENHVELGEMTLPEILRQIELTIPRGEPLTDLMLSFINKAKTNGLTIDDINSRLTSRSWSGKQGTFALMMVRIWQDYELLLKQNDMIDFNDMISLALQVLSQQNGQVAKRYSHILIDEFQDITDPQLELIKSLLGGNENNSLFCVGDDRQNIFSFAGSNIYNILHFDKQFPYAERTILSTNYRCPKNVVAVSNYVANENKNRIESNVVSASEIEHPIFLIQMLDNAQSYDDWELQRAIDLIKQLIRDRKPGEQIMVLARTNNRLRRLELEFPRHEMQGLRFLTIHRAKGTEADYVLLLGCVRGRYGFPIETMNQRIFDIVKRDMDDKTDELEEERRLFYVAITRCKKQLYLFTAKENKSLFVSEIESFLVIK